MARQFDIVIAGGGLVGAAAACLFARDGFEVAVVERGGAGSDAGAGGDEIPGADTRVSAINLAAAALFEHLAVWREIARDACAYRAMKVWDRHSAANIGFCAADLGRERLGNIVANRAILAALREKLRQNYHVTLLDNREVSALAAADNGESGGLRVELSGAAGETVETRLLVGADGAGSKVRELAGLTTTRRDFCQDAITATLAVAGGHRDTAWQCFLDTGPAALLPLADGRCALVWSCARAVADEVCALPAAAFCARLQAVFGAHLGDLSDCGPRRRFPLIQHHADSYIAGELPIALIGDAAHAIHPLAGLGANIGLVDAAALAQVAGEARRRGRDIGRHSVLRRYARWRRGDNAAVVRLMAGFHDLFSSSAPLAKAARAAGFNLADALPPLKAALAGFAGGLYGDLPRACRV